MSVILKAISSRQMPSGVIKSHKDAINGWSSPNCEKPTGPRADEVSLLVSRWHELVRIQQGCTTSLKPRAEIWNSRPAGPRVGMEFWGGEQWAPASPPAARGSWERCKLPRWGTANAFWCILSSEIASDSNFFDYLFKLKKLKWCTLMHLKYAYTFGVPNNWKPSKIPDFGMNWNRTIRSCHIFLKMCAWNQFLKVLWQVTRAKKRLLCTPGRLGYSKASLLPSGSYV